MAAFMVGEETFRRYWLGDVEIVNWLDEDAEDVLHLLKRDGFKRSVMVENL